MKALIIVFKSKSFLQNQVRSMVGCLKYLSSGKWNVKNFKKLLSQKKELIVLHLHQHMDCIY